MKWGFGPTNPADMHLDALQGESEQRTETYRRYGERAAQLATQQCAKSFVRVFGSAKKQGKAVHAAGGYTIVETMIFLLVTGALLIAAIAAFNGRAGRTQFAQSVQELDSRIRGTINEVSTGFYPQTKSFSCNATATTGPTISTSGPSVEQGANTGCIFLGKVMQFDPQDEPQTVYIYTIVGRKYASGLGATATQVSDLTQAHPLPIVSVPSTTPANPTGADITDSFQLGGGLRVTGMLQQSSPTTANCPCRAGAVGFFQSLGQYSGGNIISASQNAQLVPVPTSLLGQSKDQTADAVMTQLDPTQINPKKGMLICLASGSSDQTAAIQIGSNGRTLTTDVIFEGASSLCP